MISHLFKLSVEIEDGEDTEKMRLLLKKAVLAELLKTKLSDSEKDRYQSLPTAIGTQIKYGTLEKGYGCCFSGCRSAAEKQEIFR